MILEKYSCEQYAGVHDQEISFRPGMNVVLGDNEAGKSTMISGILDALQMPAQLDGRKHKAFLERSFPSNGANAIDVTVRLNIGGEQIVIKKEWDREDPKDGRTTLRYAESGIRHRDSAAEEKLSALLQYGSGVYRNIIFGRQDNENDIIDWFFRFLNEDADAEITTARERVAGGVSAASGISEELFLHKLEEKRTELGRRWDFDADGPENRKDIENPWKTSIGGILAAYYEWRTKCKDLSEGKQLIERAGQSAKTLSEQRAQCQELNVQKDTLQAQQADIKNHDLLIQRESTLQEDLVALRKVQGDWPLLLEERSRIDELMAQLTERELRQKRSALKQKLDTLCECQRHITQCRQAMDGKENVEADAKQSQKLLQEIDRAQVQLSSTKLNVALLMEAGHPATLETADGVVAQSVQAFSDAVSGYAKIFIPGVGEVTVAPENVDVDGLSEQVAGKRAQLAALLEAYSVETVDALQEIATSYHTASSDYEAWLYKERLALGTQTADEVVEDLARLQGDPDLVICDNLDEQIASLLVGHEEKALENRKAVVAKQLKNYQEAYTSLSHVNSQVEKKEKELEDTKEKLDAMGEVSMSSEEYEERLSTLKNRLQSLNDQIEQATFKLAPLIQKADEIDLDALKTEASALEASFQRKKKLYAQYTRIKADFERLQGEQSDQYGDFYRLLNHNLQAVAGDELSISLEDGIISRKNPLPKKEFLSQGTKKLILLAFRLALLKYYYQNESGVIVLDDILLDMDPSRRTKAAALLTEFAQTNQVIFTTCDPAIADLLGGNRIDL